MEENSSGVFGNDGLWVFALLILLFGSNGFGGFGGNRVGEAYATQADIQRAVDLNSIKSGQADIAADIQRTNCEQIGATKDAAYNNLGEIRDIGASVSTNSANIINNLTALQSQMQSCCCTTQRSIDSVKFDMANYAAAIQANDTANTQKILDSLATNRMADMQNQINALQLQAAMSNVVKYPTAITYNGGISPFCGGSCGCSGNV